MTLNFKHAGTNGAAFKPIIPPSLQQYALTGAAVTSIVSRTATILKQEVSFDILTLRYLVLQINSNTEINTYTEGEQYLLNFVLGNQLLAKDTPGLTDDYREGQLQLLHIPEGSQTIFYPPGTYRFLQLEIDLPYVDQFIADKRFFYDDYNDTAGLFTRRYNNLSLNIPVNLWVHADKILSNKHTGLIGRVALESAAKELLLEATTYILEYQDMDIPIRKNEVSRLQDIRTYILRNLDKKITTMDLCREFQIGRTSLYNGFKQLFGEHVQEFIRNQKIDRSMDLLKQGIPVNDVAFKVGFLNPANFIRAFKQRVGTTPTAFKKQHS